MTKIASPKRSGVFNNREGHIAYDIVVCTLLAIICFVCLYPFWNVAVISLNDAQDTVRGGLYFWPRVPTLESYKEVFKNTEKTVAFFYISTDGKVVVRRSTDYIPKMIEIAGARYVFKDLDDESGRTAVDMSMEQFYASAIDADYIIYNGSIDSSVKSMEDLIGKDPVMKKMKAVKEGNCWVTKSAMYQRTDLVAEMILDFHKLFSEDDPEDLKYIDKLE